MTSTDCLTTLPRDYRAHVHQLLERIQAPIELASASVKDESGVLWLCTPTIEYSLRDGHVRERFRSDSTGIRSSELA